MPLAVSGRRIGYVGATSYLFSAGVRANLLLGLRHHPRHTPDYDAAAAARRKRAIEEARRSGNSELDIAADWVDYQQAGVTGAAVLESRIVEVLRLVGLEEDVYVFGLRGRVDPELQPEVAQRIVEARPVLADRLSRNDLGHLVERLASDRYNANSPVDANLLFGTPIGAIFEGEGLARNAYLQSVLDRVGQTGDIVEVGAQLARIIVELLARSRPEHEFFEELGLISAEDLLVFERILTRKEKTGVEGLAPKEKGRFVSLAFKVVAACDPLGLVDEGVQQRVLRARWAFAENLPKELRHSVEFFDPDRYNAAAPVQQRAIRHHTSRRGRQSRTGPGRDHRSAPRTRLAPNHRRARPPLYGRHRQKVAIAVLKRPDLIAFSDATTALDSETETAILRRLKDEFVGRSLFCSLHRTHFASAFDQILIMEQGRLVDQGRFAELQTAGNALAPLMSAK